MVLVSLLYWMSKSNHKSRGKNLPHTTCSQLLSTCSQGDLIELVSALNLVKMKILTFSLVAALALMKLMPPVEASLRRRSLNNDANRDSYSSGGEFMALKGWDSSVFDGIQATIDHHNNERELQIQIQFTSITECIDAGYPIAFCSYVFNLQ